MRQAVLCGYYGMGNGGDEALLATLLQMLPKEIQPLVLSANPKATENLHQVEASDRYSVFGLMKILKRSDLFIWGGGSLMQDATSARNPIYYGGLMGLAQGMGLQTVAWAQGVGPLKRGISKWIAKRAFQGCNAVSVRDRHSAELLANWQIESIIAPDPVWALESTPMDIYGDIASPRVAVVLRSHPSLTSCRLATITEALQKLQVQTNAYILLVPFQPSQDKAIAQAICDSLNEKFPKQSQIIIQKDPRKLKGVFRGVDLAIAMRLHGVIMAAAEGCQCSAISYDPKVSYLMEDLDISGWELENLPDDAQSLADVWINDLENKDQAIAPRIHHLKQQALIHKKIFEI
ncbi:polysaccharide pyruvyl transferase CsaB [Pseudanabaena sp. FACHB-1998]|uniref:polysaccharide pyruvyl transferase CsaB n=1 Tax=Pseudanabaena sp. FACHB-1998 TaxID=2692858 RepID=UPI001681A4C3|nr:polysaccharide pyruvyl transferase CsaB [Pseudanabaena sp. FACHB-1998]MBD2178157.1 polysaccharide pyruvyl transferase CsaB [Pseudanabaena sp. FACHB-1998]